LLRFQNPFLRIFVKTVLKLFQNPVWGDWLCPANCHFIGEPVELLKGFSLHPLQVEKKFPKTTLIKCVLRSLYLSRLQYR
jgi:hypothetical protein